MFPVVSDEQAIEYKKKLAAILSDISDAHIDFTLRSIPKGLQANASTLNQLHR
ncbi:hypothetical protein ES703_43606 [subsurface metagenome]